MRTIGNIIWLLFGGLISACAWLFVGCIFYITIVGIPLGRVAFRMASLTLAPFGSYVQYGGGLGSFLANIVWIVFAGAPMALLYLGIGFTYCITVIGIPWGLQCFKLAKLSLMPFGSSVQP